MLPGKCGVSSFCSRHGILSPLKKPGLAQPPGFEPGNLSGQIRMIYKIRTYLQPLLYHLQFLSVLFTKQSAVVGHLTTVTYYINIMFLFYVDKQIDSTPKLRRVTLVASKRCSFCISINTFTGEITDTKYIWLLLKFLQIEKIISFFNFLISIRQGSPLNVFRFLRYIYLYNLYNAFQKSFFSLIKKFINIQIYGSSVDYEIFCC